MKTPGPLPTTLRDRPFTVRQALDAGVSRSRLRSKDIQRVGYGVYRWLGPAAAEPTLPGSAQPLDELTRLRAAVERCPDTLVSGASVARLWGWPLPWRLEQSRTLDLLRPRRSRAHGDAATTTRRVPPRRARSVRHPGTGLVCTTPEDTWFYLAARLSVPELVVLGDHLIRTRGKPATGLWSHTTVEKLRTSLGRHRGQPGIRRARAALDMLRDGADSPRETELRLAMDADGLPEPELQIQLWDPQYSDYVPATTDLGYAQWKIAIQYEGKHHNDPVQVAKDTRRDAAFLRAGWVIIRVSDSDWAQGFTEAVQLIRAAIRERSGGDAAFSATNDAGPTAATPAAAA